MLVDQHMRPPGMRPFDLEMAASNLTMEEKALLQARIQLLGLRTPFPTAGPVNPHALSPHLANAVGMGMHGGAGFPHFGAVPAGSPPGTPSAVAARISEAAAAAAAANALNLNGSLSQLYAMAAASSASPGATSPGSRGGPMNMASPGSNAGGDGGPQVPLPIQLWTQWASLHGLAPLAPTLLAHHAQIAAAMAAVSTSSAATSPNHLSSLHHSNGPGGLPPGRPLSNGSSNSAHPGGNNGGPSNEAVLPRLPRPIYPVNSSGGGGPTSSSPLSGMHRYSPYTIPINNSANRSHHMSGGGGGGGSVGSLSSNKSPSPIGSPDSLRDEVLS